MSITARDRKILIMLVPILFVAAFWFLLLAPKREEAASVADQLEQAEAARDTATAQATQMAGSKVAFARDYATVIKLGKSVPAKVDMPSLLVQLDKAAEGTGIDFVSVSTGERTAAAPAAGASGTGAAGAPPAQSGPGQAAQGASNAASAPASSPASAPAGAAGAGATPSPLGLESVPLDFQFTGSFFDLADFFHQMKRFVRVANNKVLVNGRLITIDSFSFDAGQTFPAITAQVKATVYLAPKSEGATAGASPQGPAPAAPGAAPQTASAPTPPAATVTR